MKNFINIKNRKLIKATYGNGNNILIVTDIINNLIDIEIKITNDIFKKDPIKNKVKELILIFNDKTFNIKENDYLYLYDEPIVNSKIDINNIQYFFNVNNSKNYLLTTYLKDETNIIEWIYYHLLIGFNKILIIDLNSVNNVKNVINNYHLEKFVDVILHTKNNVNIIMNQIILPYLKNEEFKYFINLDINEYLNLNNKFTNIDNLLKLYNYPDSLVIHSLNFGSNSLKKNKTISLISQFTKSDKIISYNYKTFFKTSKISYFLNCKLVSDNIKYTNINNKSIFNKNDFKNEIYPIYDNIFNLNSYINNYCIQSEEDFLRRKIYRENINSVNTIVYSKNVMTKHNIIINDNLNKLYFSNIQNLLKKKRIKLGFIILRCVRSEKTKLAWINCYNSIRKYYNSEYPIMIIDDNSIQDYILDTSLENTFIINSEFKQRGEILPYYYYLKNNFCERVLFLHDSMSLENYFNFIDINEYKNYTRIFIFKNDAYKKDIKNLGKLTKYLNDGDLIYKYHLKNINVLFGCFGVCFLIDYKYLKYIDENYNISNLVNCIHNRNDRKTLERLMSLIFLYDQSITNFNTLKSLFGTIHKNIREQQLNVDIIIKKKFFGR